MRTLMLAAGRLAHLPGIGRFCFQPNVIRFRGVSVDIARLNAGRATCAQQDEGSVCGVDATDERRNYTATTILVL